MKNNLRTRRAFTLVEIMIVVLIIGILMAIAVPNFIQARTTSRKNSCIANLKQIDSAKEQFAMVAKLSTGATVLQSDIAPTYIKSFPSCPGGGVYTIDVVGTNPSCSLAASPDFHVLP